MTGDVRSAAAKIRAVARLRDLCRRLPHVPTETERRLLDRFHSLRSTPATALPMDVDAIAAGWRGWWREQRIRDIIAMANALPADIVDADRRLATYAGAARLACGPGSDETLSPRRQRPG